MNRLLWPSLLMLALTVWQAYQIHILTQDMGVFYRDHAKIVRQLSEQIATQWPAEQPQPCWCTGEGQFGERLVNGVVIEHCICVVPPPRGSANELLWP